ncbi:MAG: hypothetical protein J0H29_18800 [Sphingobacteriales bacterium]|nr:hypothetical protein [Sphingobacteriales bacterium]OJY87527.1 MAG: hypothetical protein BGP14_12415 [Sphingobacteriales bacterium 44-15]
MKREFIFFVLVIFFNSCKQTSEVPVCNVIEPRANIKSLLDSFVMVNGQNNAEYGIYIDKTSPHDYDLILYTGNEPLTKEEDRLNNQYPVNKVRTSNIEFKVYSGVEHYFQNTCDDKVRKESVPQKILEKNDYVIWVVKDSAGMLTTYKTFGAYPFIALPKKIPDSLKFNLPDSIF